MEGRDVTRTAAPQQPSLLSPSRHQYQSVLPEDLQSDFYTSQSSDVPTNEYPTKKSLPWRPVYLRRAVLLSFITLFVLIIVAIESLLFASNKNKGIATANSTEHYLWTYGPTAFLTGVAAVWARTEYQSKLVAPWIRLSQHRRSEHAIPASRTLLLDYVSEFSIFTLFTSLRHRDFTVFITTLVSMLIKVLIILSSGLISLDIMTVTHDSYPMVLENKFVDDSAKIANAGNLAWYVLTGLELRNLTLPDGISSKYAFQSVQTDLPSISETGVVADGLRNSLQCDSAELNISGATNFTSRTPDMLNLTISSPGCKVASFPVGITSGGVIHNSTYLGHFDQIQCDGVNGDGGRRVLLAFSKLIHTIDTSRKITNTTGRINLKSWKIQSTSLLCTPTYAIERVQIIQNGTHTRTINPIQGAPTRVLDSVTAWDIFNAQYKAGQDTQVRDDGLYTDVSGVPLILGTSFEAALTYQSLPISKILSLFDPIVLQSTAEGFYQQIGAIIAKTSLMEPAEQDASGSVTVLMERLTIHSLVAQLMVGLLAACILLTGIAIFIVPAQGFLPQNPSTLFCSIPLFLWSHELLYWMRYAGASDEANLAQWLGSSTFTSGLTDDSISSQARFRIDIDTKDESQSQNRVHFPQVSSKIGHPNILHPIFRSLLCLVVVGIIVALELLLHKSNLEYGLGDVNKDSNVYIHYAWTVAPAVVFGALSMTYSAMDFQIRALAPYMTLKNYVSKDVFTQLELLDMTIPVAMYKELRLKTPWALATTTALLFASLFTTLSASLFQEASVPSTTSIVLQANQSFLLVDDAALFGDGPFDVSSLILESNLSFPRFTFNDLAFPQLVPPSQLPTLNNTHFNESALSISTVIPALRARMECKSFGPDGIHPNLTINYTDDSGTHNPLEIWIDGENDCDVFGGAAATFSTYPNTSYFSYDIAGQFARQCSKFLYIWGKIDYTASPIVQHVGALACNSTFEAVDVNTTFTGIDLDINAQNPPSPLESTARNTTFNNVDQANLDSLQLDGYNVLAMIDVYPHDLSPFFAVLVTSPWAVPISALGDPSATDSVIDAIKFHHGIIQAQTLTANLVPANETNATLAEPIALHDNDARPRYNATVTDATSRRRVVQDAVSTHVLVALLGVTLVLFLAGWASSPGTDVLPRSPTTIASVAALLAGGNIFSRLQHCAADGGSPEDINAALGGPDAWFWMGWGNMPDDEGRALGGENEAGVSQFGIFVVDKEEVGWKR
ncbi:hypothetical protein F5Y09DRAFT_308547 [Xylaria sp. FL1042]|nr:hypothetical protein F5Y09DRAFT_308547 [Xylaria sp. FL1042]